MADTKVVCTFVVLLHLTASLTKARINKLSKKSAAGENSLKALVAYNSINSYMNILLNFFFTSQVLFWLYYLSSVNNHHLLVSLTYYFPLNCFLQDHYFHFFLLLLLFNIFELLIHRTYTRSPGNSTKEMRVSPEHGLYSFTATYIQVVSITFAIFIRIINFF